MISSDEYSPFLNWNPKDPVSIDSVAQAFVSLVSMVRDDYQFGEELVIRASTDVVTFVRQILDSCSLSNRLALVSSKLFPRMLSTPHLRDLSVLLDKGILNDILVIKHFGICLASTNDIQSHSTTSSIDPQIFQVSAFHQPTRLFVCSSHIPMLIQSLLSEVERVHTHQFIIWSISDNIGTWKTGRTKAVSRGKKLLQTLEREGFRDELDRTLLHENSSRNGELVKIFSLEVMEHLGMNCPRLK
ncbi:hypothetical protein BLNAU_22711 [Blattamonas nauphoetae]|uniref:Uncharacterized protein n=1 Tax=Blattamonas nauphoetae TaxID=2049346 RepID=A0ABQ9WS98_9EUKA|nr:hypothetical protein BLNAU_22711 [Blattamonas nauphoetae]